MTKHSLDRRVFIGGGAVVAFSVAYAPEARAQAAPLVRFGVSRLWPVFSDAAGLFFKKSIRAAIVIKDRTVLVAKAAWKNKILQEALRQSAIDIASGEIERLYYTIRNSDDAVQSAKPLEGALAIQGKRNFDITSGALYARLTKEGDNNVVLEKSWGISRLPRDEDFDFGMTSLGVLPEDGTYELRFEIEDNGKRLYRSPVRRVHVVRRELIDEVRLLIKQTG